MVEINHIRIKQKVVTETYRHDNPPLKCCNRTLRFYPDIVKAIRLLIEFRLL
jgi:hypothetical protein